MPKFATCLMYVGAQNGHAEEAVNFYVSLFKDSKINFLQRYGAGGQNTEGLVQMLLFSLDGQPFMAMDGGTMHNFDFTPATSIFITCDSETEIDALYQKLIEGGSALMPLGNYGFSKKFGWVNDRFGVSWQMSLPA